MKRVILVLAAAFLCTTAQAQSLGDLLKSLGGALTSTSEKPKEEAPKPSYPTEKDLVGEWTFEQLDIEYTGDDPLASVAIASAKSQISTLTAQAGLAAGKDKLHINNDGTLVFTTNGKSVLARYSYIQPTGTLIVTVEDKSHKAIFTTLVSKQDGKLRVMFDANELMAIAEANMPNLKEDGTFVMAKTLVDSYKGILIGGVFK
jgi:hypothetical protein